MELLATLNVITTLVLALIVGRQSRSIENNTAYIEELEDDNAYMHELLNTPFDKLDLIGSAGLDE